MLFRSWLTFTVVIGVVQAVLGFLAVLQHDAIFSELLRQRIAVIAQTTVASYQPIVRLGLPISMIRNGNAIVGRARSMDGDISAVHTFNPSGIIVHSTQHPRPQTVQDEALLHMRLADEVTWGGETETSILSGHNVTTNAGDAIGAVVVVYPKDRLSAASDAVRMDVMRAALLIWFALSAVAFLLLRLILSAPRSAIERLDAISRGDAEVAPEGRTSDPVKGGLFSEEISRLERSLSEAAKRHDRAMRALAEPPGGGESELADQNETQDALRADADPSRSLARAFALRLAPLAAMVIATSAILLGVVAIRDVNRSIEPEMAARSNLIGAIVGENVERALDAGAPLEKLVGAENYFGDMLIQLPEVSYIAVATGRVILEAGQRIDPYLAPPRQRKDVRSHPIMHGGEEVAYVVIDIDPAYISQRFRDVFLDVSVVVLVTVLIAFECMVLLTSRSLTAGLDRLQGLASMHAAGDFSAVTATKARGPIGTLAQRLSDQAEKLHVAATRAFDGAKTEKERRTIKALQTQLCIVNRRPAPLRVSYFTDVRLALFLFAAADELPLAFLPLYTRASENLWPWLDVSVLISLPLAGYLLAILVASPFSRALTNRFGVRLMFLGAAAPMIGAHLGLYYADSAQAVIFWRTITGIGYAFVTLSCQDYVLDSSPAAHRDRTLGVFTLVLFGGVFAGVALGGVLADRLGQQNVFLLSAALIVVSCGLSAWMIAPGTAKGHGGRERLSLQAIAAPLRNRRFASVAFGLAIPSGVVLQAFTSYLVAITLDSIGTSTADIGRALMLYFMGVVAAGPLGGRLADAGVAVDKVALAGAFLSGASLSAFVIWPTESALVLAVAVSGIGFGLVRGAQVSLAMTIAETDLAHLGAAAVLGSLRMLERLGSVVGLLLIAGIAGAAGYTAAAGAIAAWSLAGGAVFALAYFRPVEASETRD